MDPTAESWDFPEFRTFPVEIRLMVWRASWEPRNVAISRSWKDKQPSSRQTLDSYSRATLENDWEDVKNDAQTPAGLRRQLADRPNRNPEQVGTTAYEKFTVTKTNAQPPVSLWVDTESRLETLKYYRLSFGLLAKGVSQVYFNFDIDALEIPRHIPLIGSMHRTDLAKIKSLIVPRIHRNWERYYMTSAWFKLQRRHPYQSHNTSSPGRLDAVREALLGEICQKLELICPKLRRIELPEIDCCKQWIVDVAVEERLGVPHQLRNFRYGSCSCDQYSAPWEIINLNGSPRAFRCYPVYTIPYQCSTLGNLQTAAEIDMGSFSISYRAWDHDKISGGGLYSAERRMAIQWLSLAGSFECSLLSRPSLAFEI